MTAGAGAGAWSAVIVLALVTLVVLASWVAVPHGTSDLSDALRSAGLTFVAINGAPLHITAAWITIPLLGLAFIPVVIVRWAVGRAVRALDSSADAVVGALIGATVIYAAMVGLVAWLASTPTTGSPPFRAAGWGAGVAVVGVLWATHFLTAAREHIAEWPQGAIDTVRAASIAVMALIGAAFITVAVALVAGATTIIPLYDSLHAGIVGSTLIFLLGLGWLPALASWSWSWLVGSGFAVGAGTSVLPGDVHLGAVPAFPWFGALPSHGPMIGSIIFLVPIVAGALMYPVLSKAGGAAAIQATVAAGLVGVVGAVVAWIGHGSIGPGRLSVAGPMPLATGLRTFAFVALGAMIFVGLRTIVRVARTQVVSDEDEVPSRVGTAA
jgi:hypothetical protein